VARIYSFHTSIPAYGSVSGHSAMAFLQLALAGVTIAIGIAMAIAIGARSVVGMLIGVDLLTLIQIEVTFATV